MPGVFLSCVEIETLEDFSKDQQSKPLFARKLWKNKYLSLFVFLPLVFLFFIDWNPVSAKIVDLPEKHPDFIGRTNELAQISEKVFAKREGDRTHLVAYSWGRRDWQNRTCHCICE